MKRKYFVLASEVLLYIIAAVAFFQGFQIAIANLLDLSFMTMQIPMFGPYFSITYWLFAYHGFIHTVNEEKRKKVLFGNGIGFIATGLVLGTWGVINMVQGKYYFGLINFLFPIDLIVINFIGIVLGILMILKKEKIVNLVCPIAKERPLKKPFAILKAVFGGLYILIGEYLFGGYLLKYEFLDPRRELFGFTIPFLALVLVSYLATAYREILLMVEMDEELDRKIKFTIGTGFVSVITVLSLFVIVVNFTPAAQYITYNFQPYFILDYISSLNLAPWLVSIPAMIAVWLNYILFLLKKH